jgi:MFS family permease
MVNALPESRLLKNPGLTALIGARSLSSLGYQMQAVILGWQMYALTHSAWSLGLVGLAQFAPFLALVFIAGTVVDRTDRRRIAIICQGAEAVAALSLALITVAHTPTPALLYVLAAATGAARAFESPSLQALLPSLVPQAAYPRAAALSASVFQCASIAGPSLGGLLYGAGSGAAYAACAMAFALAAACSARLPARVRVTSQPAPTLASFFEGVGFVVRRPDILGAISLDLFAVLLGGATALLPVYAGSVLHAGPLGLGLLRAAPGIGALVVSLGLSRRPLARHLGPAMFSAIAVFGVATIVFGVSTSLPLSVASLALLGGADVVSVVIRSTLVQIRTPDDMRGRVAAVNLLFIGSSNQLGEFESGTLATLIGVVPAVVAGGLGTLAVAAIWMVLFPGLRRLDRVS